MSSAYLAVMPVSGGAIPPLPALSPEAAPPPAALTLYDLEEQLAALADTLDIVPADQEDELVARIGEALVQAKDKRDAMGRFLAHLESQAKFAAEEIERLRVRKEMFERIQERTENYILRVIMGLGKDAKGKWAKLEGRTVTFSLRKLPASVAIEDESLVPTDYRRATVKLPAVLWDEVLDALDVDTAGKVLDQAKRTDEVSKTAVKTALQSGTEVPGAKLVDDGVKLVRG